MASSSSSLLLVYVFFILLCVSSLVLVSPVSSSSSSPSPVSSSSFLSWCSSHSISLTDDIQLEENIPNKGRGIRAVSPINVGSVFLSVPLSSVFTIDSALSDSSVGSLISSLSDTDLMAVYIGFVRNNPSHPNYSYFSHMIVPPTPLFYSSSLMNELVGTQVYDYATRRNAAVEKKYQELSEEIKKFLTEQQFKEALSLVWSRLFRIPLPNSSGELEKESAFVPVVDLLNTGDKERINVDCTTNTEKSLFQCHAIKNIAAGEELLALYGIAFGNSQLLNDYGFVLPSLASSSQLTVRMPVLTRFERDTEETLQRKLQLLDIFGKTSNPVFTLKRHVLSDDEESSSINSLLPNDLWAYARIIALETEDIQQKTVQEMYAILKENNHLNDENDHRAVGYLLNKLEYIIRSYPTTLSYDYSIQQSLKQGGSGVEGSKYNDPRFASALSIRIEEKELIQDILHKLEGFYQHLEQSIKERETKYADRLRERDTPPSPEDIYLQQNKEKEEIKEEQTTQNKEQTIKETKENKASSSTHQEETESESEESYLPSWMKLDL